MSDRDRLRQAFEETFDMNTAPGFRQAIISRAVATGRRRPQAARFAFAAGAAAAVVLIAGAVALLHVPSSPSAPAGNPSPSPTASATFPSTAQVDALIARLYPAQSSGGGFVPCDLTGSQAACPYTSRLKTQMAALRTTACLGCQNPSPDVQSSIGPEGQVSVFLFRHTIRLDLTLVSQGGQVLVDDIRWNCPGSQQLGTSVYQMHLAGTPGQGPVGPAPIPSCPA
jgi:hypothetical protein